MKKVIAVFVLLSGFSLPAWAETQKALDEIEATVHGVTSKSLAGDALTLNIIDIGADYDFMALVTCRLLRKHGVEDIEKVFLRDSAQTDRVLGDFLCAETLENEKPQ